MKLYYAPGACSLAPHIALCEAGLQFELESVNLTNKQTASGEDFSLINVKGYVPAIRLDDGQILTEVAVILQYIADQTPASQLAPATGTIARYRLMEWLNFISSELHKQFSPLFNPKISAEWKTHQINLLARRFDYLVQSLDGKPCLMGDQFTVADAYLFTILNWSKLFQVDMERWPALKDYIRRVAARPAVRQALGAEGLVT